jgi:hypothetical protein
MPLFPFAQFEVAGRFGIADGRYLARDPEGDADDVLVVSSLQAPRRGRRRRSRRAKEASDPADIQSLPATRATVVRATAFDDAEAAKQWLAGIRRNPDARDEFTEGARALVNLALHAHRAAAMDPYATELGPHTPIATRVGYGDGDELAAGSWREAVEAPPDPGRRRRAETLRPQERLAAVLAGRERIDACETLVLRARLDLEVGRTREAALQLEPAVRALLAEVSAQPGTDQAGDLERLRTRLHQVSHAAEQALGGDLPAELTSVVADSLAGAERVLRRRRVLEHSPSSGT